jgi:hypothetical protein
MMTTSPALSAGTSLLDISQKAFAVDRSVDHARRVDPVAAQGGNERQRAAAIRDLAENSILRAQTASSKRAALLRKHPNRRKVGS